MKGLKETYKDLFGSAVSGTEPNNPDVKSTGNTTFDALVKNADTMSPKKWQHSLQNGKEIRKDDELCQYRTLNRHFGRGLSSITFTAYHSRCCMREAVRNQRK